MRLFAQQFPRSLCIGLVLVTPVLAAPVLHEKFAPNPAEDLRFFATTPSGKLPASLQTSSGAVSAPEESQTSIQHPGVAYGGSKTPTSVDANFHLDKVTTRPDKVQYDEPFRPSILPYKRSYAFDLLQDDMSFSVQDKELVSLSVGGDANENEDTFFADFSVDLVRDVPVRIPSLGPGARVRALHVDPMQAIDVLEDGAENWFVRAAQGGRARLVFHLSIERAVFGSRFAQVTWTLLAPHLTPVPQRARFVALEVLAHIDVDQEQPPTQALDLLVQYFRRFRESEELPKSEGPLELYRELSFERKGVCRHRAYAFAVTAMTLGLPTRLVHNEAHAWVEVFDSVLWHRIDLGGAASNIRETRQDAQTPQHRPPMDPFSWPEGSRAGSSLARALPDSDQSLSPTDGQKRSGQSAARQGRAESGKLSSSSSEAEQATALSSRLASSIEPPLVVFTLNHRQLLRGRPLSLTGNASRRGRPCSLARIDIYVDGPAGPIGIGALATNRQGEFEGQVTLPNSTKVGPLRVSARVAGGCD